MRFQLGILSCLLAGCLSQPTPHPRSAAAAPPIALPATALHLGVEYLPPATTDGDATPPRAERLGGGEGQDPGRRGAAPPPRPGATAMQPTAAPAAPEDRTLPPDDILGRALLRFFRELTDADQRRVRRELGAPILTPEACDLASPDMLLPIQEVERDEQREWQAVHGAAFLQHPLLRTLRSVEVVDQFDIAFDEFRADSVPLSQPWQQTHDEGRPLGRVSMRLRCGDPKDPVELTWLHSGVRVGSSADRLKLGFGQRLADDLALDVHTRCDYATGSWGWRCDLGWRLSARTGVHFVAGDDLDFLATSTVYSLFESPMDGSPGLLVYVVHIF